ncbi:MAG: hypothetical protein ABSG78_18520 [Verrucomicrobiota bacterium]|jgi:hypothetical protein
MKTEPILAETYGIKEMLAAKAGNSIHGLCVLIETSMSLHAAPAREVHSTEELAALVAREEPARLAAIPQECLETYRIHNPIIAEIHRIREQLNRERENAPLILKDEPPPKP